MKSVPLRLNSLMDPANAHPPNIFTTSMEFASSAKSQAAIAAKLVILLLALNALIAILTFLTVNAIAKMKIISSIQRVCAKSA